MQNMFTFLRRKRHVGIAAVVFLVIFYYLTTSEWESTSNADPTSESGRLERHMNANSKSQNKLKSKNSFDWSKIDFAYPPPKPLRRLPTGRPISLPQVQHHFPEEPPAVQKLREERRQKVRQLFKKNWASYRKYAWMKDALQPISAEFKDQFSGWAATLVDSLDTLWDGISGGTVRLAARLEQATDAQRAHARAALTRLAEPYRTATGYELPHTILIART